MIRPMYMLALVLVAATLTLGAGDAGAQVAIDAPTIYRLNPASSFQQGCFPPCLCPIRLGDGVRGTLVLAASGFDGLFNNYTVTGVNWTVTLGDQELRVTGSGTYKVGGEFAVQQQLGLDLKVGDDAVQHFDSGLVPGGGQFPDISVTISIHGQVCFDTVFVVDASPVPTEQIHPYVLLPESTFQRGCFPPCLCPLEVPRPISGMFALVDLGQGPLFTEFAVVNVDWLVSATGWSPGMPVRGVGTYRVGGEFAVQQRLSLDLIVNDEDQAHFDSGLVLGGGEFPLINSLISIAGMRCFDTVIDLHAQPVDGVMGGSPLSARTSSPAVIGAKARYQVATALKADGVLSLRGHGTARPGHR